MTVRSVLLTLACTHILTMTSWAGVSFYDDFEDGSAVDGSPVSWAFVSPWDNASFEVVNGSLAVTPGAQGISGEADLEAVGEVYPGDVFVRSQVYTPAGHAVGFFTRNARVGPGTSQVFQLMGVIAGDGQLGIAYYNGSSTSVLGAADPGWDPFDRDVNLEFDLVGEAASLRAWPEGAERPAAPQITANISRIRAFNGTQVTAGTVGALVFAENAPATAEYRFYQVLVKPTVPGDFNNSGALDTEDMDLLSDEVHRGSHDPTYDLNADAVVDAADRTVWVQDLAVTWFGDADLDLEFNSQDFVAVFAAGKYETGAEAGWAQGDWNGNGRFDSADFVTAFRDGGYEIGPRPGAVSAAPEPTAACLLASGLLGLLARRMGKAGLR